MYYEQEFLLKNFFARIADLSCISLDSEKKVEKLCGNFYTLIKLSQR